PGFFEQTLETVSLPIFALFFVLAGYSLHLEELSHLGVLGIVYIAARSAGKILGVRRMAQRHGEDTKLRENTGLGLLCHAGVAVFLGSYLVRHWSDPLAQQINTVILASVALYELVGPFLVKHVAISAGEVKTVTLLRPGFFKPTWISPGPGLRNLAREYNPGKVKKGTVAKPLTAGDLMRTNIHYLPAAARFDEVLSFIERSRFHDFPVVNPEGKYLGVIHFEKVRNHIYNPVTDKLVTAVSLADQATPCVTPQTELPKLLELFHKHNLGDLPVVKDTVSLQMIGIIEQRDLLKILHAES
ncbi:MAG: CBS domain-containing protein, partial [Elusimicrobiota bacterium]